MRAGILAEKLLHIRLVPDDGKGVGLDRQEAGDDLEFFRRGRLGEGRPEGGDGHEGGEMDFFHGFR